MKCSGSKRYDLSFSVTHFGVESCHKAARLRRMKTFCRLSLAVLSLALLHLTAFADDKPRVFITDSTSWEVKGSSGGSSSGFGSHAAGGARPQTAEIIKTFGERCPDAVVNNKREIADYIVVLDHEGGKSVLAHRNKIAVFTQLTGDAIISKSTLSLGGSVQDACQAITKHWAEHGQELRAAAMSPATSVSGAMSSPSAHSKGARVTINSTPGNSDIEVDGNFVGSTPSVLELTPGQHQIGVRKSGYQPWQRKMNVTGGDVTIAAELERAGRN